MGGGVGGGGDGISISNARSFSNNGPPRQSVGSWQFVFMAENLGFDVDMQDQNRAESE